MLVLGAAGVGKHRAVQQALSHHHRLGGVVRASVRVGAHTNDLYESFLRERTVQTEAAAEEATLLDQLLAYIQEVHAAANVRHMAAAPVRDAHQYSTPTLLVHVRSAFRQPGPAAHAAPRAATQLLEALAGVAEQASQRHRSTRAQMAGHGVRCIAVVDDVGAVLADVGVQTSAMPLQAADARPRLYTHSPLLVLEPNEVQAHQLLDSHGCLTPHQTNASASMQLRRAVFDAAGTRPSHLLAMCTHQAEETKRQQRVAAVVAPSGELEAGTTASAIEAAVAGFIQLHQVRAREDVLLLLPGRAAPASQSVLCALLQAMVAHKRGIVKVAEAESRHGLPTMHVVVEAIEGAAGPKQRAVEVRWAKRTGPASRQAARIHDVAAYHFATPAHREAAQQVLAEDETGECNILID